MKPLHEMSTVYSNSAWGACFNDIGTDDELLNGHRDI